MSIPMIITVVMLIAFIISPRFRKIILVCFLIGILICSGAISFT